MSYQKKYYVWQGPFHHSFHSPFCSFGSTYDSTSEETTQINFINSFPSVKRVCYSSFYWSHLTESRFESTSSIFRRKLSSHSSFRPTSNLHSKSLSKIFIWTSETLDFSLQKCPSPADRSSLIAHGEMFHVYSFYFTSSRNTNLSSFLDHKDPNSIDASFAIILIGISFVILFNIILLNRPFDRGKDLSSRLHTTLCQAHRTFSSLSYDFATISQHLILSTHSHVRSSSFRIDQQVSSHW